MTDPTLSFAQLLARGSRRPALLTRLARALLEDALQGGCALALEDLRISASDLRDEPAIGGPDDDDRPLVLSDTGRVYLRRHFQSERVLGEAIRDRLKPVQAASVIEPKLNPAQRQALALGLSAPLTLIFGGPGTGKTHTAGALISALARSAKEPLQVALAAPTGKAAARLREAIGQCEYPMLKLEVLTLHQLLGLSPHNEPLDDDADPMGHDLIVLDECSMVPLGLLAALFKRSPPETRLLLMGDPDQLDAVNEGFAFAELRALSANPKNPLHRVAVTLTEQRRFSATSALYRFAEATRLGHVATALEALKDDPATLSRHDFNEGNAQLLLGHALVHYRALSTQPLEEALAAQRNFQILSARKTGPFSVDAINQAARTALGESQAYFENQPLLIERNSRAHGLRNGDLGLLRRDEGELKFFCLDSEGGLLAVALTDLPAFRPAYALTIHKAQGSEFAEIAVVLTDIASPILSRQLIYTAVTRAKQKVRIYSSVAALSQGIDSAPKRVSGLADWLPSSALLDRVDQLHLPF